ncbi:AbiH family protein [Polaribacter aquimarinus]|uniref:Bacteriophage abortive infection AbiH n=1 Tax=Polaribacter aquimarinus TaxID=2100726 RepID=A0A2U2JAE0_9FLAO|nr:AbiH family protein [Polaribacter aquimarinus]PWG05241.1 hypothetical protein DIS07_08335 [Polaribacter aquimarinus]
MKRKEKIYNRLILVGNGFDLALGIKTSYNDFLFWYLKSRLLLSVKSEDIIANPEHGTKYNYYEDKISKVFWKRNYSENDKLDFIERYKTLKDIQVAIKQKQNFVINTSTSVLFRTIYDTSINSWIDVEQSYYVLLKKHFTRKEVILKINEDFEFIKNQLEIYLTTLKLPELKRASITQFIEQFFDGISKDEIIDINKQHLSLGTKNYYFLNFNYTDSLRSILDSFSIYNTNKSFNPSYQINHIHGKLNSKEERIIFGYGDEMDNFYTQIQDLNDNEYLKNIKSFQYFQSQNYRNLLRFVNSNEYQVCIYGHSCGLSDRVMLNEIFENDNCKSIKIYYYKDERDYVNKTMEISRHFKDNNLMRQKIVNFKKENIIPQLFLT